MALISPLRQSCGATQSESRGQVANGTGVVVVVVLRVVGVVAGGR